MSETHRTKSGRVLTDADIQKLADEAERGYDVDKILTNRIPPDAQARVNVQSMAKALRDLKVLLEHGSVTFVKSGLETLALRIEAIYRDQLVNEDFIPPEEREEGDPAP